MSLLGRVFVRTVDALAVHPRVAAAASRSLETVGALTLADRVDRRRSGGDIVAITLPPGPSSVRARRIKMYRHNGADQIARALHDGGWRAFEPPIPDIVVLLARRTKDAVVYDVGANTGLYALLAITAGRDVTVQAFEPARDVLPLLEQNLALAPRRRRVTVLPIGVSDRSGVARLYVPTSVGLVETSSSLNAAFKESHEDAYDVPVTTLDEHWSAAGRPEVTLVKVDVEGHELPALQGAAALIDTCRPVLLVEVLSTAQTAAFDDFLAEHDLVDVRISPVELVVGDAVRWHELAWNHLFVPGEKVDELIAALGPLGLSATDLRGRPGASGAPPRPAVASG